MLLSSVICAAAVAADDCLSHKPKKKREGAPKVGDLYRRYSGHKRQDSHLRMRVKPATDKCDPGSSKREKWDSRRQTKRDQHCMANLRPIRLGSRLARCKRTSTHIV